MALGSVADCVTALANLGIASTAIFALFQVNAWRDEAIGKEES